LLYQTSRLILKDERAAVATGIIYIVLISTWSFYGISITPEIFFNLFTIAALYVLLKQQNRMRFFMAGLIAGAGFMVKYLVLLDFAAFILFIIFLRDRKKPLAAAGKMLSLFLAATGFLIPFALTNLWYYLNGHFNEFYNIVYLAPSRYPSAFNPMKMLKFLLDFHLRFLPVFLMYYYVLFRKNNAQDNITGLKQLGIIWSVFVLFAVLISGKTFGHYMIQLMLPVSVVAGGFLYTGISMPPGMEKFIAGKWVFVFIAVLLTGITLMKLEYIFKKDIPREIAAYLKPRLNAEEVIYTGNYHHIIYYLLKKDSPTKYIHRSLLLEPNHIRALDIDVQKEFLHIMAQKPVYIIIKQDYPDNILKDFIEANYLVEKQFEGGVLLYHRKGQ
jgi:hypothetical protein